MFHVDFLGVLFIVWGLLTTVIGLSTLALGVGAAALNGVLTGGSKPAPQAARAPRCRDKAKSRRRPNRQSPPRS